MYPEPTSVASTSVLVVVMVVVELLAPTKDMSMAIAIKRKDCMALEESWDRSTSALNHAGLRSLGFALEPCVDGSNERQQAALLQCVQNLRIDILASKNC